MADPALRERLQPALLDRLRDPEASILDEIARRRRALEGLLDEPGRAELGRLLGRADLSRRRLAAELPQALRGLGEEALRLLQELAGLEEERREAAARTAQLGMRELRALVLRDLETLLNTEGLEGFAAEEDGRRVALLDGLPEAARSIVNYGIPALAGKVHTRADCDALAQGIARAIERFEPRLAKIRVAPEGLPEDPGAPATSPASFLVEGELWGFPVPEPLRLRTVLDLEEGRARIGPAEEAA